jgi:cytochrome P450
MSLFSGMTNIPFMIVAHGGFRSEYLRKLHKKHPVIRTGPNALSFSDPQAIKYIYGHGTKACKDDGYIITSSTHMHLADVVDKADHARKRKILSSAYALKNLEEWEHKVADKVERLIVQFDRRCTSPLPSPEVIPDPKDLTVNYREWTNFFTIDAIADIGLSERLGFLDRGNDQCMARRTDGSTYEVSFRTSLYNNTRKQSLLVHSYKWYKTLDKLTCYLPFYRTLSPASKHWDACILQRSAQRLDAYQKGKKYDDFFQALMEDKNGKPNNLEWGEINAEVNIMMNAGSTTTAIAMANVLYHVLKHPPVLERVRKEIDSVLDVDEVIAPYDKVKNLPYLRACLDESLRIFSPTTHGLGRNTPQEGMWVLDDFIAGGVSVSMSAYVVHHQECVFPNASQYIPERWLGEEGKSLQPYFLAFSSGARGCIGRNISYLEQTVLLASLLRRYEFAFPGPGWEVTRLETQNLLVGDMPMKVWRREVECS